MRCELGVAPLPAGATGGLAEVAAAEPLIAIGSSLDCANRLIDHPTVLVRLTSSLLVKTDAASRAT